MLYIHKTAMLDTLTLEVFEKAVDEKFQISGEFGHVESTLIDCTKLVQHDEEGRVPFSIVFRGPMEPFLEQRTYKLSHEKIGEIEIFLVPLGPDKTGMKYEAIFT